MAAQHASLMVLKVDLQCCSCFLKVKKVLAKFPQIGDQVYDWKQNEVTISVMCCNTHKILHKLRSKGGNTIKSIKIKESGKPKPKPLEFAKRPDLNTLDGLSRLGSWAKPKDTPKSKNADNPKHPQQPNAVKKPKELQKKVSFVDTEKPKSNCKSDKPKTDDKSTKAIVTDPSKTPESAPKLWVTQVADPLMTPDPSKGYPIHVYPWVDPAAACYRTCYDVYVGGPCQHGYGQSIPPPLESFGHVYEYEYGGNRAFDVNRADYFSEENPSGCSIM